MSLPKEPRQKMINMMYLVLTALLALNVSSEILNAFKTVNTSIGKSNDALNTKNNGTFAAFQNELADGQTKARAELWAPKAQSASSIASTMVNYIEELKLTLKKKSGLKEVVGPDGTKEEDFHVDDLDAPTRLFVEEKKGDELYNKLGECRKQLLDVLNPDNYQDAGVKAQVTAQRAKFEKTFAIDLTVPKSQTGEKVNQDSKSWTSNYFHMTPTIAAVTILSKFQNDVTNCETQLVDYCHEQVGHVANVFNKFQAIATANTTYAMPGDKIEITAGVGAFNDKAQPKIYVDGALQTLTADGTALYSTTASGAGERNVNVKIEYVDPNGTPQTVNKIVKYTVGQPAGVSVSPTKMNVLYIGVDNPISITAGVGAEKINASFTGGGDIHRVSGPNWVVNPKNPGEQKVNVIIEGKSTPVTFRVRYLPDPAAFVGPKRGGSMPSADFKAMRGVIAKLVDCEFESSFKVVSYQVGALGGKYPTYQFAKNMGNLWSGAAGDIINGAGPGTSIFFDQIRVVGPDGRERELPQMSFNLK
jgi:gliding motility-associated protein GldM